MANILVLLEVVAGQILPVSFEALGQARRVATALGATVYALVPLQETPSYGEADLVTQAADKGADRVVLLAEEALLSEVEMRHGTYAEVILAACDLFPPALFLCGATTGAADLGARLAARLSAVYLPEGFVEVDGDHLLLCDHLGHKVHTASPDGDEESHELEHRAVLTLPPGRYKEVKGGGDAEMLLVAADKKPAGFVEVGVEPASGVSVLGAVADRTALQEALGSLAKDHEAVLSIYVGEGDPAPAPAAAYRLAIGSHREAARAHYHLTGEGLQELVALLSPAKGEPS